MKRYMLKSNFRGLKKGTELYLIADSEFIGVKEYVLRTIDLKVRLSINEKELRRNFILLNR